MNFGFMIWWGGTWWSACR